MTRHAAVVAALFPMAISGVWAAPPAPSSTPEFQGSAQIAAKNGGIESAHVDVESWAIPGERGPKGPTYQIPLQGFYVAHLINGEMWTTVDGQTTKRISGDYWTVKPAATMQVKVLGELALLETIVLTKQ